MQTPPLDAKKILIVEDNTLNLKLFRDLLKQNQWQVVETSDGRKAIAMIEEEMPDLVIMDIQLHGISGFDLICQMKEMPTIKNIPVIAVTAFAMKDDKEKIMASGCDAYISKPISIGPFVETVRSFL